MIKSVIRFIQGVGYFLLGKEPDEIKLARAEAEIRQQEAATMQALEELGGLIATHEREVRELEPQVRDKENQIKALLEAGKEDLAAELADEFDYLESQYLAAKSALDASKEDLQVRYRDAELQMEKIAKRMKSIKDNRKRAAIDERLNNLRKATSAKRFDASGLHDDLATLDERTKERLDKAAGSKMVLDMATKQTKAHIAREEALKEATGKSKLARFAAKRGIPLSSEKTGAPPTLGEAEQNKTEA